MKSIYIKFIFCSVLLSALSLHSCTLDEYNPGAFTKEALATSIDGYETLINQCYFAMERFYYGAADWMSLTEGDTDLWTYKANESTSYTQWFWFFAGTSPNTTYTNNWWNGTYDGVGACNEAIALGDKPPYTTEEERNAKIAEARFLRAVYYFNAVEQFGAVTMLTEPVVTETLTYSPTRTDPMTIYQEVILPDLRFASEWLPTGTHATTTTPTKKAALGFLAKACLQTYEYGSTEYLQEALDAAKKLITDCETGGGKYNTYMYPSYSEVFKESNNWENKEALWKHRWYAGADGHGLDFGILNGRIDGSVEWFKTTTKGLLFKRTLPITSGLTGWGSPLAIWQNIAQTSNQGVEATITSHNIQHKDFTWNTTLSVTWNKEQIDDLPDGDLIAENLFVGEPIKAIYGYKYDGIWGTDTPQETLDAYGVKPGFIKIETLDQKGDGGVHKYSTEDRQILGHSNPDWIIGFSNSFTYKNFDLSIFAMARYGQTINSDLLGYYTAEQSVTKNQLAGVDYWTEDNQGAYFPRPGTADEQKTVYPSLRVRDGSFIKIKNITLGYTLPVNISRKVLMEKCRIYATAYNPFIFVKDKQLKDTDPETNGSDAFPTYRQFVFGVNLTF
jgi:hypothetical protein